ncbi:MAG: type II toxin-antitoxin system HicA family toxin, partial [Firmicutes bacterium]|nr:type II toxin-antitoxin system HicA family toxin [Bacillota bacterium]
MKQRDLIKLLIKNGWYLKEHGSNHDKYTNGINVEVIPRHSDINENLA